MVLFIVGVLVPVGVYVFADWWLNSTVGVTAVGALVMAVSFAAVSRVRPRRVIVSLATGVVTGSAGLLVFRGPGTIWPIVLVIAGVLAVVFAAAGTGAGILLHRSGRT